jgi:uncharacterized CHY-type Zn-finger protein
MKTNAPKKINGKPIDNETRCVHYHSSLDIIAIKMKCCNEYFPCIDCHNETTHHLVQRWQKDEFNTKAILCGFCKKEMSIQQYLNSNHLCPYCNAAFNPGCRNHHHLYFEID